MSAVRPTDSAKMIRSDLRAAFPATKFSVRTSNYSTCRVSWTDGPTVSAVEALIGRYEGKGFDGMTDSTYYMDATMSDGRKSAIGYLFCSRSFSDAYVGRLIEAVGAYYSATALPSVEDYRKGRLYNVSPIIGGGHYHSWESLIQRAAKDRSSVTREEVTA